MSAVVPSVLFLLPLIPSPTPPAMGEQMVVGRVDWRRGEGNRLAAGQGDQRAGEGEQLVVG